MVGITNKIGVAILEVNCSAESSCLAGSHYVLDRKRSAAGAPVSKIVDSEPAEIFIEGSYISLKGLSRRTA